MRNAALTVCFISLFFICPGCSQENSTLAANWEVAATNTDAGTLFDGLSEDFRTWLDENGYAGDNFARTDLPGGAFGGKAERNEHLTNQPVIFIHGNGDKAVGTSPLITQAGWNASLNYFLSHGYKKSELYATTWGPADLMQVAAQYHSRANVTHVRRFIEAVLAYTGAEKVDIISHSMGVTLARKAIKGGAASDMLAGGDYSVGKPLTSSVDTFIGISGANRGLTSCYFSGPVTPTCGNTNGFYPGTLFFGAVVGRSAFLNDLESERRYEGSFRYSIWSKVDEIIGYGDIVYGSPTSAIPGQTNAKVFSAAPYGHFGCKDLTAALQLQMVKLHRLK